MAENNLQDVFFISSSAAFLPLPVGRWASFDLALGWAKTVKKPARWDNPQRLFPFLIINVL